jgi:hypothetical protein
VQKDSDLESYSESPLKVGMHVDSHIQLASLVGMEYEVRQAESEVKFGVGDDEVAGLELPLLVRDFDSIDGGAHQNRSGNTYRVAAPEFAEDVL